MEWLNYHHLYYFWLTAKEGSITKACLKLRLAQPTLSAQIKSLEDSLNEKLFSREGRNLKLTEIGKTVFTYAEEIFSLGKELRDTLRGRPIGKTMKLTVGISDVLHKIIVSNLLEPIFDLGADVQLVCLENRTDQLFAMLVNHELDVVLSDKPLTSDSRIKAYNHLLGECSTSLFSSQSLAKKYKNNFPKNLNGAPFLLPTLSSHLRIQLDQWFEKNSVFPKIIGEIEDSALIKVFGQKGKGLFAAPTAVSKEICRQHHVVPIKTIPEIKEQFYAISVERKIKHPAVLAITQSARNFLLNN